MNQDSDNQVPQPESQNHSWHHFGLSSIQRAKLVGVVLMLIMSASAGFVGGWLGSESYRQHGGDITETNRQQVVSEGELISEIASQVGPSVVSVSATRQVEPGVGIFGGPSEREGAGTGFILSEDGVIVTNRHVVPAGTTEISIVLSDGTRLDDIEVIGRTSEGDPLDIAFLRVNDAEGNDLTPVELGRSAQVDVGDRVVAIGNALGQFQNTVTSGIISGFGRDVQARDGSSVDSLQNLFQTDAAINQGNSGGPLVNIDGQVIGVNTAVAAGSAQNIGFAIPIDDIKGMVETVLETGRFERPYLGVRYISITDDFAQEMDLPENRGAYIPVAGAGEDASILPDSPAADSDLQEGDIITHVGESKIDQDNSLASVLAGFSVGEQISLSVIRDGDAQTIDVTLGAAPTE